MKYLAIAIVALAALVAADDKWEPLISLEDYRRIHTECVTEAGVTSEQDEKIRKHDYADEKEVHDYTLCRAKKLGIFDEETGFNADRVVARFEAMGVEPPKAREIAEKCVDKNEQKSTSAEWVHRVESCFMNPEYHEVLREATKRRWRNNLFRKGGMFETVMNSS